MSFTDPFYLKRFFDLDDIFGMIDPVIQTATKDTSWPPYNITKPSENKCQLQFALAGFSPNELSVRQEGDYLVIEAKQEVDEDPQSYLHRGIFKRDFLMKFLLTNDAEVNDVVFDNGILSVDVKKQVTVQPKRLDFDIKTPFGITKSETSNEERSEAKSIRDQMTELSS